MKTYKVTLFLGNVDGEDSEDESFKDAVKEAMLAAIDLDDSEDQSLDFIAEEEEDF